MRNFSLDCYSKKIVYWDTKHNKMVQLLKIAASIVIGKTMDDSIEGELNI